MPHKPTVKQSAFLLCNHIPEILFGGAAGGGKSDALLMASLQYVDMPNYNALLLRRTFQDLALPGAIMPRSMEWLSNTDARWNERDKRWTFPSGATLSFGYLQYENDKYRYQSSEFQFIGFDELTQFTQTQYTYMFSRMRRSVASNIPLRMRSASNPGGVGHVWVKTRFIDDKKPTRLFIPSKLTDNPHLDQDEYMQSLQELDMVTRQRLRDGDWDINESGGIFRREWFGIVDHLPVDDPVVASVRYWDLAGTEPSSNNPDPDYTVGLRLDKTQSGKMYISDIIRVRLNSGAVERVVSQTAQADGKHVQIGIEQEPGSSGKAVINHYQLRVLSGYMVKAIKVTGSKLDRARPVSAFSEGGHIMLKQGVWNNDFLSEVSAFTGDNKLHDDQVDALSGAYDMVSHPTVATVTDYPDIFGHYT